MSITCRRLALQIFPSREVRTSACPRLCAGARHCPADSVVPAASTRASLPRMSARLHCPACARAVGKRHRFCAWCGTPLSAAGAPGSASLQIAGAERGRLDEERRTVTILFADLTGSTTLAEGLDPEHFREI